MVNLAVAETLAVRGAAWSFNTDGGQFHNDLLNDDLDFLDDQGGRLTALWKPTDNVSLLVTGEVIKTSGPSFLTYSPDGLVDFLTLIGAANNSLAAETPGSINRDTREYTDLDQVYLSANLEWQLEVGKLNLIASWRDYEMRAVRDGDSGNFNPSSGYFVNSSVRRNREDVDNTYIELLWTSPEDGRFTWVSGISWYEENFDFERVTESTFDMAATPLAPGVTGLQNARTYLPANSPLETDSFSVFAEASFDVTERLNLFASLRYIKDDKSINFRQFTDCDNPAVCLALYGDLSVGNFGAFGFLGLLFPDFTTRIDDSFSEWLPGVGVRYQLNDNVNLYGTIQTGTRAGGFNTTTTQPAFIAYKPEYATTYEVGMKSTWLDRQLVFNASAFLFEQDDFLLFSEDPVNPFFSALRNVGKAETWGAEFELNGAINSWLTAGLTYGYLHPEVKKGINFGSDISGNMINRVREHTVSAVISWD